MTDAPKARLRVRAPSIGALLDVCAAVPLSADEGADVFGPVRLSGDARPTAQMVTAANASAVISALDIRIEADGEAGAKAERPTRYGTADLLVQTARAGLVQFYHAVAHEEALAGASVDAVARACVAYPEGGGARSGLERALGSMPRADALALWDAPLSVAIRLLGWGAVHAELTSERTN